MKVVVITEISEQLYKDVKDAELRLTDKYGMWHTIMGVKLTPLPKYLGFKDTETETSHWPFGDNLDRADGYNFCLNEIVRGKNED